MGERFLVEPSPRERSSFSALAQSMPAEYPSEYGREILPLHPLYDKKVELSYHMKKACNKQASENALPLGNAPQMSLSSEVSSHPH